jgi:hypothetical protein
MLAEADAWVLGTELGADGVLSAFPEQAARPVTTATAAKIATPRDAGCMIASHPTPGSRRPFP